MSERLPQFPDKQYAIRRKGIPHYYLSDEASLEEESPILTAAMELVAFYGSPEMARAAWKTFFNTEDGEVVRWSPESIEVVA